MKQTYLRKKRKKEKGSALFLALVLAIGLIILGTSYISSVHSNSQISLITYAEVEAMHIAEAGAELALLEVNHGDRDFLISDGWTLTIPNNWTRTETIDISGGATIGEFDLKVKYIPGSPKSYEIVSRGYFPSQANQIASKIVKVLAVEEKLFKDAIMGYDGINIGSGALVDSYDSRIDLYGVSGNVGTDANFVTNSTADDSIEIGNTSVVTGDISIGAGGIPANVIKLTGSGTYNGTVKWLSKNKPKLSIPDQTGVFGINHGPLTVANGTVHIINNDVEYDSIKLEKDAILKINANSNIYVIGDILLGVDSQIIIIPGYTSKLWINGNTDFKNGATINNPSQDPLRFKIYCTDNVSSFDLGQHTGGFYGNIYAPNADVWIGPDTVFYGSIVGKTVRCTSGLQYHYDVASRDDPDPYAPTLGYFVIRWQGY